MLTAGGGTALFEISHYGPSCGLYLKQTILLFILLWLIGMVRTKNKLPPMHL